MLWAAQGRDPRIYSSHLTAKLSDCRNKCSPLDTRDFGWWQSINGLVSSGHAWKDFHHYLVVWAYWEIRRCGFDFSQVKEETEFPHAERTLWLEEVDSECKEGGLWLLGFVLSICGKYAKANPWEWVPCGFSTQETEDTETFMVSWWQPWKSWTMILPPELYTFKYLIVTGKWAPELPSGFRLLNSA